MNNIIEKLNSAKALRLEALQGLHSELGFESREALIGALTDLDGAAPAPAPRKVQVNGASAPAAAGPGRGRRVPTDTRKQIEAGLKAGTPAAELARLHSVSYPYVHSVKGELGLVGKNKGSSKSRR